MFTALDQARIEVKNLLERLTIEAASYKDDEYYIAIYNCCMLYLYRSYEASTYNLSWLITQIQEIQKQIPRDQARDYTMVMVNWFLEPLRAISKRVPDVPPGSPENIIVEPQYTQSCLHILFYALQKARWNFIRASSEPTVKGWVDWLIKHVEPGGYYSIDHNKVLGTQNFNVISTNINKCIAKCESFRDSQGILSRTPTSGLIEALKSAVAEFQATTLAATLSYDFPTLFRNILAWLDSGRNITKENKDNNTAFFLREVGTFVDQSEANNPLMNCRFANEPIGQSIRAFINSSPMIWDGNDSPNGLTEEIKKELRQKLRRFLGVEEATHTQDHPLVIKFNNAPNPIQYLRKFMIGQIELFLMRKRFKDRSIKYICTNLHQAKMLSLCNKFDLVSIPEGNKWTERYTWINIQCDEAPEAIFVTIVSHLTLAPLGSAGDAPPPEACTKMIVSYKLVFMDKDQISYRDPQITFSGPNKEKCRETFLRAIMDPGSAAASPENPAHPGARSRTASSIGPSDVSRSRSTSFALSAAAGNSSVTTSSSAAVMGSAAMGSQSAPLASLGSSATAASHMSSSFASAAASSAASVPQSGTPSPSRVMRAGPSNGSIAPAVAMPPSATRGDNPLWFLPPVLGVDGQPPASRPPSPLRTPGGDNLNRSSSQGTPRGGNLNGSYMAYIDPES